MSAKDPLKDSLEDPLKDTQVLGCYEPLPPPERWLLVKPLTDVERKAIENAEFARQHLEQQQLLAQLKDGSSSVLLMAYEATKDVVTALPSPKQLLSNLGCTKNLGLSPSPSPSPSNSSINNK